MTQQSEIIVIASYMRDLVMHIDHFPRPGETRFGQGFRELSGGKGSNQALQAAKCGASVAVIAALGIDDGASIARNLWRDQGIDTTHVLEVAEEATGVAMILVDEAGENQIVIAPGALSDTMTSAHIERLVRDRQEVMQTA